MQSILSSVPEARSGSRWHSPFRTLALGPVLSGGAAAQGDDALRAFLREEGYGTARVLPMESGQRPRLVPAINAALRAQALARDAVVLLLDGSRCGVPTLAWRHAVRSAVALDRPEYVGCPPRQRLSGR